MKCYTTDYIWKLPSSYLKKWFWTDGYFVYAVKTVREKRLKDDIENQG